MTNTSESDFEMQRFESSRPSQLVRLKRVKYEGRSKTARHREVSRRPFGPPKRGLIPRAGGILDR